MTNPTCSCCNKLVEEHKVVKCVLCNKHFFHQCVDLTVSEVRTIKSKKSFSWTCSGCTDMGSTLNELKSIIISLKKEVAELKSTLGDKQFGNDTANFEEVVQEVSERQVRRKNLILFKVRDPENASSSSERQEQDKLKVLSILSYLMPDTNFANINPVRLGRFDPTKSSPRPIKIRLEDERLVHEVMRKARNLRNNNNFSGINISCDRTPRQIAHYKALKDELNRKTAEGNVNLAIKYVKGVPKIVSTN